MGKHLKEMAMRAIVLTLGIIVVATSASLGLANFIPNYDTKAGNGTFLGCEQPIMYMPKNNKINKDEVLELLEIYKTNCTR